MPKLRYETGLALLLGMTFGVVMFDRTAINSLSPFIVTDLGLNNSQIGAAAAILSLSWAIGGLLAGRITDLAGRRKPLLLAAVVVFSVCSMASGLVAGFLSLFLVRLMMGFAEGPVPALSSTSLMEVSKEEHRGRNVGLMTLAGGVVGLALSPVVLVAWADQFGWRSAFLAAGVPGLLLAVVLAFYMRERPRIAATAAQTAQKPSSLRDVLATPNVLVSAAVAVLMFAAMFTLALFLPLYFVQERGFTPAETAAPATVMALGIMIAGMIVPLASDRFGRKPVTIVCCVTGLVLPIACLIPGINPWMLAIATLPAAIALSIPGVIISIVPGESVSPADRGAALGLVMGAAEAFGGFGGPALAGLAADRWGLSITMYIAGGCMLAAAAIALLLRETAPRKLAKPGAPMAAATNLA